jgi:hypothetical protein
VKPFFAGMTSHHSKLREARVEKNSSNIGEEPFILEIDASKVPCRFRRERIP